MRNDRFLRFLRFLIPALSLWLACCAITAGYAQEAEPVRERICLQTDKDLYLAGELAWLKAVTTDAGGRPLDLSKVVYVELLDDSAPQVQIKLEITGGLGEGSFFLPLALPTGYYRLVAYTRYMRNEGEAVYSDRLLPVINPFVPPSAGGAPCPAETTAGGEATRRSASASPSLSTDRAVYPTRAAGELRIEGLPAGLHTLSVSIAGIDSLTPAATGRASRPRELAGQTPLAGEPEYAEYEGHVIAGKLIDLATGQLAAGEKPQALLGFAGDQARLFGGQVNERGDVRFFTRQSAGVRQVATAVVPSSSRQYRIDIQSPFARHTYTPLPALSLRPEGSEALSRRSVGLQAQRFYTADSTDTDGWTADTDGRPAGGEDSFYCGEPDWRYLLDEYTRFGTMAETVIEFIPGLRFRKTDAGYALSVLTEERVGFAQSPSLVLLDGIPLTDHELIYQYNPLLVKEIEIYKGKHVFGGVVFDGLVIFKTFRSDYPGLRLSGSTQLFAYEGTQRPRLFQAPAYQTEEQRNSRLPDCRHTLLWKPQVEMRDGRALIPFTTSDLKGAFEIKAEGLSADGESIYATAFIRVE
jgi:hypothetical protein